MGEWTESMHGHILAYGVLLSILVDKVEESDPTFEYDARRVFDTHLGKHFARVGKASPMEMEAQKMFNAIISTAGRATPLPARVERPLT
jgi:hypothetical protein